MKELSHSHYHELGSPSDGAEFYPPKEEAHLRDYWKIVLKYRRLILLIFIVVFSFGAWIISGATPMYTAAATIKIDPQPPSYIRVQEVIDLNVSSGDYYSTQHELMKSRRLAAKVITDLNLGSNPTFTNTQVISPDPVRWLNSKFFGNIQALLNQIISLSRLFSKPSTSTPGTAMQQAKPAGAKQDGPAAEETSKPTVDPGLIGRYLSFLRVEPMRGTRLVRISFVTPDPFLSQQLANAHASAFVRMNLETRFEVTKEARVFLEKKLAELKSKVEQAEAEVNNFRNAHGVVSMDRGENLIVDRMIALNSSLTTARIKRIELDSLRQMLSNKNLNDLSEVMNNGTIQQYRTAIESLTSEQVKLGTVFKPDHPRMIELQTRINDARQRMKVAIDDVVRRIQTDYDSARNKEASLEAEAGRQKQAAIDLKTLGVQYSVLQGEVDSNRTLYNNVLARLNETTISNDLPVSNMQVTELADTPGGLISGGQQLKLLMTTASGALFLGVALAFCLAYFDSTVGTPEDVWRFLFIPTLGIVPELRSIRYGPQARLKLPTERVKQLLNYVRGQAQETSNREIIIASQPTSILSESYRSIRTALLFSQPERPPQTVLFTSPGPGEGKTVTTLNLAVALAQSGKRVLILDADMRKGRCHKSLRRANDKGLSNILSGNLTLEESLQETAIPGLSLISRGLVPPNPADLLGSSKMKEVLDLLRNRFEFILLDAPPVIGVTDAEVLSTFCDGVILVLHSRKTNKFSARQALQTLEGVKGHILGVVLNAVDIRAPDYSSYRYYYSSYYASVNAEVTTQTANENEEAEFDQASNQETSWPTELTGIAPAQLFEQLTAKLSEAVGPMAPLIVQDHVALMGESFDGFPKARVKELFDRVCQEILNEDLRNRFEKSMLHEIQHYRSFHA